MKSCETCLHWQKFNGSYPDHGECKANPPRMNSHMLWYRSNFFQNMSPVVQNQSTLWPVTTKTQYCDIHELEDD